MMLPREPYGRHVRLRSGDDEGGDVMLTAGVLTFIITVPGPDL